MDSYPVGVRWGPKLAFHCANIQSLVGEQQLDTGDAAFVGRCDPTPICADRPTMANISHRPPDRCVVKTEQERYPTGRYDSERIIVLSSIEERAVENDAVPRYPDDARCQETGRNINENPHRVDDSAGLELRLVVGGRLGATGMLSKLQQKAVRTAENPHRVGKIAKNQTRQ